MYKTILVALFLSAAWLTAASQNADTQKTASPDTPPIWFGDDAGITRPTLLSFLAMDPPDGPCDRTVKGDKRLNVLITPDGKAVLLSFQNPDGSDLELLARQVIRNDRFQGASKDGAAGHFVAVLDISLRGCYTKKPGSTPNSAPTWNLFLSQAPKQQLEPVKQDSSLRMMAERFINPAAYRAKVRTPGGSVTPPRVISSVPPEYTDLAKAKHIQGDVLLQVVVNPKGIPEQVMVLHSLEMGLDQEAIKAVWKYRFAPGTENGVPVSVQIMMNIGFRLTEKLVSPAEYSRGKSITDPGSITNK